MIGRCTEYEEGVATAAAAADPPPKKGRGRPKGKSKKPLTHALLEGGVYAVARASPDEADRPTKKQKKKSSSKAAASEYRSYSSCSSSLFTRPHCCFILTHSLTVSIDGASGVGNRAAPEQGDCKGSNNNAAAAAWEAEDDRDMDFIDLTHPVQRRVLLDFIAPYELDGTTTMATALDEKEEEKARGPLSQFFFGVYHGSLLHQSAKDQQLHYKLHSSAALNDFLLKSNDHQASGSTDDDTSDFFSFHQTDAYNSRVVRLGDDYQADIPVMMTVLPMSSGADSRSAPSVKRSSRSASTINDGVIWHCNSFSEDAVQDFLQLCDRRRRLQPLRVGMVVVVDLATVMGGSERAYRLCCILDITINYREAEQSEDSLMVFDGYDVSTVDPSLRLSIVRVDLSYFLPPPSLPLFPLRSGRCPSAPALGAWRARRRWHCNYSRGTMDWSARLATYSPSLFHPSLGRQVMYACINGCMYDSCRHSWTSWMCYPCHGWPMRRLLAGPLRRCISSARLLGSESPSLLFLSSPAVMDR